MDSDRRRLLLIAAGATALLVLTGIVGTIVQAVNGDDDVPAASTSTRTATSSSAPQRGWGSPTTPATVTQLELPCQKPPQVLLDEVTGGFLDGQHLENAQSVDLPLAMTMVGGDIVSADGERQNSREAWVYSDGALTYASSSSICRPGGAESFRATSS